MSGDGPDWLGKMLLTGKYGTEFLPIAVDENGQLYIVIQGIPEVTIPDAVDVTQTDSVREVRGTDGATLRTLAVDPSGQLIMVPRGQGGNYMAVDASGFMSANIYGLIGEDVEGDNDISNPGFETYTGTIDDGNTDTFPDWSGLGAGGGDLIEAVSEKHTGSVGLKITSVVDACYIQVDITVVAGEARRFRIQTRGDGAMAGRYFLYDNSNAAYIKNVTSTGVTGTAWTEVTYDFDVPVGCTSVRVGLGLFSTNGVVYFDDVELVTLAVAGSTSIQLSTDQSGQIVMVPRGQNGYYMAVDSEGNLSAMLKALYGSAPTGVACDADGRIKFLLCDGVDMLGQYLEVGNAELAGRIVGCPVSYDRRGQVVYRTDFSDGQGAWVFTTSGGGAAAMRATGALQGTNCIQLDTPAVDASYAYCTLTYPLPPVTERIGFAVYFAHSTLPEAWILRIRYYDGTTLHEGWVYGKQSDGKLYILDEGYSLVELTTWDAADSTVARWHYVKLVLDLSTSLYHRVIYDGVEHDPSATSIYEVAVGGKRFEVTFYVDGRAASVSQFLVDCPCITVRES